MSDGIVLVGGGLASQRCAETLRAKGCDAPIRMLCSEDRAPYDRPPLSKEVLAGAMPPEATALRPASWYSERDVELLPGTRAAGLDTHERRLTTGDGGELRYDVLLIATGARPLKLSLFDGYENATVLRTLDDALALRAALAPGTRLVVIGAGFIGLEAAATARALGASVTVVEAAPTPLAGVLGTELGAWFADLHRAEGVEVRTSARVQELGGRGRIESLLLADGSRIECDHVLVGVGVVPDTDWLTGSGLDDGGVRTDASGRTLAPGVYAAGDAALTYDPVSGRHARSDHWDAAARQGAAAARAMLGLDPAPALPPSFWSDQYGVRIQLVGHPRGADRIEYDGDPAARDFTAWLRRGDAAAAALLVGRPRALAAARRSIAEALPTASPN